MELWKAPLARGPIAASFTAPGSKSLTNRSLIIAALADSPTTIHGALDARDTSLMIQGLRALGVEIDQQPGDATNALHVTPHFLKTTHNPTHIDVGLAGTVMRFLPPVAALTQGETYFDGDQGARKRPMATLLEALKDLGVTIEDRGRLPFIIKGTGHVLGGEVILDASKSSQFVSALLLFGARCESGITIRHVPADLAHSATVPSLPHVHMTSGLLARHGVIVHHDDRATWHVDPQNIDGGDVTIEPDLSNAMPFFAAAMATGGTATCADWPVESLQPVNRVVAILEKLGATITRTGKEFTVHGPSEIAGISEDLSDVGEIVPTIAALCALATSPSELTGIGHLRGHETDRLSALATEINGLGGRVTEGLDSLSFRPAELHGGVMHTYHDHRMATAGAILGLVIPDIEVENIETTSKTIPQFAQRWQEILPS